MSRPSTLRSTPAAARRAGPPTGEEGTLAPGEHGRGLTAAFEVLSSFPALEESRTRMIAALESGAEDPSPVVAAIETDLGLGAVVLRAANHRGAAEAGQVASITEAVTTLRPAALILLAERMGSVDFFDRAGRWSRIAVAHRRHVAAVQGAIQRIAAALLLDDVTVDVDELGTAALLHDVGKLVLLQARPEYERAIPPAATPENQLIAERREFGVDHALVGGVLVRRWGLPSTLARLVERHHSEDEDRPTAVLRLADLIAHHGQGDAVSPQTLASVARTAGLEPADLRPLLYDQPVVASPRSRSAVPCPLSSREMDVLRRLARGGLYKEIAAELGISASTVRTHLHNVYAKIGAADRAQAVLKAVERGWLHL